MDSNHRDGLSPPPTRRRRPAKSVGSIMTPADTGSETKESDYFFSFTVATACPAGAEIVLVFT